MKNQFYTINIAKDYKLDNYNDVLTNVFTKHMKVNIIDNKEKNSVTISVNDIINIVFNKTKIMKRINGGRNTRKNSKKIKTKSKKSVKTKRRTKRRTKSYKHKKVGGGKIKKLVLGFISVYLTDLLIEFQFVHNQLDNIPLDEFHNADIFKYNLDVKALIENVDTVDLNSNMSSLEIEKQMKTFLNEKGKSLTLKGIENESKMTVTCNDELSVSSSDDYRAAFVEIDLSNKGPTSKLIDVMEKLPQVIRPYVVIGRNFGSGYTINSEWKINDDGEIDVQLFNSTIDKRFRNFPNMEQINDLVSETYKQQINIMRKTNLLGKHETSGFGSMVLSNAPPISTSLFNKETDRFHQDDMYLESLNFRENDYLRRKKIIDDYDIKLARPTITDSIMTMTYPKGVSGANFRILDNENIQNIKSYDGEGYTRMMDQRLGVEHSAIRGSRYDTSRTTRKFLLLQIMPNMEGNFKVDSDYFVQRT